MFHNVDVNSKSPPSNQATHISILKTHQPQQVIAIQEQTDTDETVCDSQHIDLSSGVDIEVQEVIADTTTVGVTDHDDDSINIHVEIESEALPQADS